MQNFMFGGAIISVRAACLSLRASLGAFWTCLNLMFCNMLVGCSLSIRWVILVGLGTTVSWPMMCLNGEIRGSFHMMAVWDHTPQGQASKNLSWRVNSAMMQYISPLFCWTDTQANRNIRMNLPIYLLWWFIFVWDFFYSFFWNRKCFSLDFHIRLCLLLFIIHGNRFMWLFLFVVFHDNL